VLLVLVVAGCKREPRQRTPESKPTLGAVAAVAPRPRPPAAPLPPGDMLAEASADLDGDGYHDRIAVVGRAGGAILVVNREHTAITVHAPRDPSLGLQVVDLDAHDGRRELLISQRTDIEEDPPWRFTVARYDGNAVTAHELWGGNGYSSGLFLPRGDGTFVTIWNECPDEITVHYRVTADGVSEVDRQVSRVQQPCAG